MYRHQQSTEQLANDSADLIAGFNENPTALFQAEMEKIAETMQELPFYRSDIPCFAPKFVLFEEQWVGTILTPWMLSVLILPGPDSYWQPRLLGDKIAVQLPYKSMTFTVSGIEQIPQYLSCSLQSPLATDLTANQAVQLAKDCLTMVLSLPIQQQVPDLNKRNIFKAMVK